MGWELVVSMRQLEMSGWNGVPYVEGWFRCGCALLCCVLEKRRKQRPWRLCPAIAGRKASVRHCSVTIYSSSGLP